MKTNIIKRVFSIGLISVMMVSSLAGCGKKKEPEPVVMTEDDNEIRSILIESFDVTSKHDSVLLQANNHYTINMNNTSSGVQLTTTVVNDYSGTYKYVKGTGALFNMESDYSVNVEAASTGDKETENTKNSYSDYYDEKTGTYYYSLTDNTQWYKTHVDVKAMISEMADVVKNADCHFTIEETNDTIKINQSVGDLCKNDSFNDFRSKWNGEMNSMTEYLGIMSSMTNGSIIYYIDPSTKNLRCIEIKNINLTNDEAMNLVGNDSTEFVIGGITLTADIQIAFSDYDAVSADDILIYKSKMDNAIEAPDGVVPSTETDATETDATSTDAEGQIVYREEGISDLNNVESYKIQDLNIDSLNSIKYGEGRIRLPASVDTFTNDGWQFNESAGDGYLSFKNEKYPDVKSFLLWNASGSDEYDALVQNNTNGLVIDVSDAVKNGTSYPDMIFTFDDITWGTSAETILQKYGRPDIASIGSDYDTYQYAMYETKGMTKETTVVYSISFVIYHTDELSGVYGIDLQYYTGE